MALAAGFSRQRMRQSVERATNESCPHCQGYGKIKNHASVAVLVDPRDYAGILAELRERAGVLSTETLRAL